MPHQFSFTTEERADFAQRGVVYLRDFYPMTVITPMAERLWADLEARFEIRRSDPATWTVERPAKFQALKRSNAFRATATPKLYALADFLLGRGEWRPPEHWGLPLVTFPGSGPSGAQPGWHLDITGSEQLEPLPTLRVFVLLEPIVPNGGGTLYVEGSHKHAIDIERGSPTTVRSAQVCDQLKSEYPWYSKLFAASIAELRDSLGAEEEIGGHRVSLQEMTGNPGDLVVMHPAVLHGIADNRSSYPRMILTEWIPRLRRPA